MKIGISTNKALATIIVVALGLVIAYPLGYWWASRSESCMQACSFAEHNIQISKEIGPVRECRIASWFAYDIRYQGPNGNAQFRLRVVGEKGAGDLFVSLATIDGEWAVQGAKLRLAPDTFIAIETKGS